MHHRASVAAALALVLSLGLVTSAQALSLEEAKCRRGIGKGVRILAEKVVKETTKCHRLRMLGRLPAVDCNDLAQIPGALKISKAEQKLALLTASQCAAAPSPQQLGYVVYPAPCETLAITDYASVATCQVCVAKAHALESVVTTHGTPPVPGSNTDETRCQDKIARGLRKFMVTRIKEQQKCQYTEDVTPNAVNCRTADPKNKVDKALTQARLWIADCNPTALATLNTCADDITAEQMCVQGSAESDSDDLFTAVYEALDGVFVSGSVASSGDGSIGAPLKTIGEGITQAVNDGKPNIFIDGGTYSESLTLGSGVNLLGGFDSSLGWRRNGASTQLFGGTTAVLGSTVTDVVIDGLTINAASNTSPGGSSYGVRLLSPTNVLIKNSAIFAGNGGPGTGGSNGSSGGNGGTGGQGQPGCENSTVFCSSCSRPNGGSIGTNGSCAAGSGGGGGRPGRCDAETAEAGGSGGGAGGGSGGPGGGICESSTGGNGTGGSPGAPGNDGNGGLSFGAGTNTYTPSNGSNGSNGSHGGGGGGGGGGSGGGSAFGTCDSYGGAGGGGGAGGCAGTLATAGTGAGGSFGVWIASGTATLDNTTITAADGGTGGNGGTGGTGGSGGSGGPAGGPGPNSARAGGPGGSGGGGGRGGHGGGGGGGPSVGIVCRGGGLAAQNNVNITTGNAGGGGSSAGNPGDPGLVAPSNGC